MLIKLWPGNRTNQLKRMNQKVDEDNGKALGKGNVRYRNVSSVFQQLVLEERWLSCFRSYLWSWGVEDVG